MKENLKKESASRLFLFAPDAVEGDSSRTELLGGKGAGLASMTEAGLQVPPGFTIPIPTCAWYHENGQAWPEHLKQEVQRYVKRLEKITGQTYGAGADPLLISVRSGAAQSMPGMMDTILNCGLHPKLEESLSNKEHFWKVYAQFVRQFGHTVSEISLDRLDEIAEQSGSFKEQAERSIEFYEEDTGNTFPVDPWDALYECINAVFDSWNNERAKIYRKAHGLTHLLGTAVNIQTMFDSEVSGIAFTADPSAPDRDVIIIESAYGLGESIVSGDVAPDRWVLDSKSLEIEVRDLGCKDAAMFGLTGAPAADFDPNAASLTDEQINELAKLSLRVEGYCKTPVDIEWGLKNGKFSLLQSRAVRGLDVARDVEKGRLEEVERLKELTPKGGKVWTVHNLAETLSAPTPLTWDVIREFMSGNGGYGRMYRDFGYRPADRVCEKGFLELICGRIYTDPDRAAEFYWKGMPFAYDHAEILENPGTLEAAPTHFDPERADGVFLLRLPGTLCVMFLNVKRIKKARARAKENFEVALVPYLENLSVWKEKDLSVLSAAELCTELKERIQLVMGDFGKESLKPGFFGGMARAELEKKLIQILCSTEGGALCQTLTSGLDGDSTMEQEAFLCRVVDGKESLEEFLERYGHRTTDEMELSVPRWREDPSYLEEIIRTATPSENADAEGNTAEIHHALKKDEQLLAMKELFVTLEKQGGAFMHDELQALALEAQQLLPYRETGKHYLMMGYEQIRRVLVELGQRLEIGDDLFFLRLEELETFEANREKQIPVIKKRKIRWTSQKRLDHPNLINSDEIEKLGLPREIKAASSLSGNSLSGGIAEGIARIVYRPHEAVDVHGSILVCPSTDPSWTSLFTRISGLVVERGGVLSHGAITARDFGIPAAACPDATKIIKNGDRIRVDGDRGHVTIIEDG